MHIGNHKRHSIATGICYMQGLGAVERLMVVSLSVVCQCIIIEEDRVEVISMIIDAPELLATRYKKRLMLPGKGKSVTT